MRTQYFVQEHGYYERGAFYEYIHNKYKLKDLFFNKDYMSSSSFPFVIDFKKKYLTVCESITCCAMAVQNKRIMNVEEFKKKEGK
ncbi:MAG: hypothetical protein IKF36_06010 [Bacilli bacterium]|nr:hypothetical protein [Bacilli bacterium]